MSQRPTISLAMIVKNEAHNLPRLLDSIEGCFDEIHITDTGSTDNTVELALARGCKVHHFKWIDDFAAARNYSYSHVTTDYVMWMDGDDVLGNKNSFLQWRDNVMLLADYWFVNYNYAFNSENQPICTFARERVVKTKAAYKWKYFIHEGMVPDAGSEVKAQPVSTWSVDHKRSEKDISEDQGRNIKMIEKKLADGYKLEPRLQFYYGKELFDAREHDKAYAVLDKIDLKELEAHDRILTLQYIVKCLLIQAQEKEKTQQEKFDLCSSAYQMAITASALDPGRAEFYVLAGDALLQCGKYPEALPYYAAAKYCVPSSDDTLKPLFKIGELYEVVPREQIAKIFIHLNMPKQALNEATECYELYGKESTKFLVEEIKKYIEINSGEYEKTLEPCDDIVISSMPGSSPYKWDSDVYKTVGIGGSETAAVEIAEHLAKLSNRKVIVFNDREKDFRSPNGVEYTSNEKMRDYFLKYKPSYHIAWRHNTKLTNAPTYLWCHDLMTPGGNYHSIYDKILCLSDFHKNFVQITQKIPDEKILITRNGLEMSRFEGFNEFKKNPLKVIFPSSPDRGLDRAIKIVDMARKKHGLNLKLHVFYGFDNMKKFGMADRAAELEQMIKDNKFVVYHGSVDQKTLAKHMMESSVWLYPADFIETFCITAIEALSSKCYPISREIGALKDTLKVASEHGMADLVFSDAKTNDELKLWADKVADAVKKEKWRNIAPELFDFSWSSVAKEFVKFMDIEPLYKQKPKVELVEHTKI